MPPVDARHLEKLAHEAFIRRAAAFDAPFMLKGSYVTRQYFDNPADRIPNDLDWVCVRRLPDSATAQALFNEWATGVTELVLDDSVTFRSFRENAFWRMIDYAMTDDFPTVNTDLLCWVNGEEVELSLDVSFNLPLEAPSVPLLYCPEQGPPFQVPHTVPLALQVSWKLHQTLVRPRFKDVFDLTHLLRHPAFDTAAQQQCLSALAAECRADNTDFGRLRWLLQGELVPLWRDVSAEVAWLAWRHGHPPGRSTSWLFFEQAEHITNPANLPETLSVFEGQLREAFQRTQLSALFSHIGSPSVPAKPPHHYSAPALPPSASPQPNSGGILKALLNRFRRRS